MDIDEDTLFTHTFQAADDDSAYGDYLTFHFQNFAAIPDSMLLDSLTGTLAWTPWNYQADSLYEFSIIVSDTSNLQDTLNASLQVNNVNDAPVFTSPPNDTTFVVKQDSLLEVRYSFIDVDTLFGDVATVGALPNPAGVEILQDSMLIRWRPDSSNIGLHEINYNVTDIAGLADTLTFFVQVDDRNDPPRIISPEPDNSFTVKQDSLLQLTVIAEDADTVYGDDFLRFTWDSTSILLTDNLPEIDSLTGEVSWRPVNAQYGEHHFTAIVRDSSGLTDSLVLNITVNDLNDTPYFTSVRDTLYFTEDADSSHQALFGWDPDLFHAPDTSIHDSILFEIASVTSPETEGLNLATIEDTVGLFQWIPTNEQVGEHTITVSVLDTAGSGSDTTITLIVQNKNNPPVISSGTFPELVFDEDTELSIDLSQYGTDIDAGTQPEDISWFVSHIDTSQQRAWETRDNISTFRKKAPHGIGNKSIGKSIAESAVHIDTTNLPTVVFSADTNYFTRGPDSVRFRFIASDPEAFSDTLERGVWVDSVNDKPMLSALPDTSTDEDTPIQFDVRSWNELITDVETDTADFAWNMAAGESHFTVQNTDELYTIEPDTNWFGEDSVLIIITDDDANARSDSAWWHITVNPVNDAPYFIQQPGDTTFMEDDSVTYSLNQFVSDVDQPLDELTWEFSIDQPTMPKSTRGMRRKAGGGEALLRKHSAIKGKPNHSIRFAPAADSTFTLGDFIFRYKSASQEVTIRGTEHYYTEDPYSFWFTVIDPFGDADSSSVDLFIQKENDPPVLSPLATMTFSEDDSITIALDSLVTDVDDITDSLHWFITLDSLQQPDYATLEQSRSYSENISASDTMYALHTAPEPFVNGAGERLTVYTSRDYFNNPGEPVRVFLGVVDTSDNRSVQSTLLRVNAVNDPPVREHPLSDRNLSQTFLREESPSIVVGLDSVFRDVDDPRSSLRWHIAVDSSDIPAPRYDSVQVNLADSLAVRLHLTPTWNYAGDEMYVIGVTDTSNTTAYDTLYFTVIDTIPPEVDVGVLQHPLITSSVDLYFFFSEEVKTKDPRPKLWIRQPNQQDSLMVQSNEFVDLPWSDFMNPPYPFYYQLRIDDPGTVQLYLRDIIDSDNSDMTGDRQFNFGADSIPAMAKATLSSPEGDASLRIPSDGAGKPGYWLSYEPDLVLNSQGLPKESNPEDFRSISTEQVDEVVRFDGPVSQFKKEARIGFTVDTDTDAWRNASIVLWTGDRWKLLATNFTSKTEQIWAYTERPGTYGILWESGVPVNMLPDEYTLAQNYPNPFNPTTMIEYALPDVANNHNGIQTVRLDIYNILGQRVRTLVNTAQKPGMYSVQWDGRNETGAQLASGIYFYRLQAGDFVKANKMVLIR
ncbi:MAG: hypothetical protein MAGBODY4_00059 [Candidatus Marinimicrobia bacterium]|nr:hypothetical protein [Candidatus Neomarinimicrobiota bacterium]